MSQTPTHSAEASRSLSVSHDVAEIQRAENALHRVAVLERMLIEQHSVQAMVRRELESVVRVVGMLVEMRDPYTGGHQRRVSELATRIAEEMELSPEQIEEVRVAALIHDVGKMAVPAEILSRPGRLSASEFSLLRDHAEAGYRVISSAGTAEGIAEIVYQHHERCDGSGYPRGLSEEELLPGAKVLMVADVVEAMASHRPYRAALGLDAALEEIGCHAGTHYDTEVSRACISVIRQKDFTFSEI